MRKPRRTKGDKIIKLRAHVDAGDTLRSLLEHPAYSGFFNAYEADLLGKMLCAPIEDDATRRHAAIELSVLAKFRQHLSDVVTNGDRAREGLEKLESSNGDSNTRAAS